MNEFMRKILALPPQASTVARDIDGLHYFVILVTTAGSILVTILAAYYLLRFRKSAHRARDRSPDRRRGYTPGGIPVWLEGAIIAGLLALFLTFWIIGYRQYVWMQTPPKNAMEIYVTGKKWMWSFAYPDGSGSNGVLYVPAHRPVKLIMNSRDVIHSFYVPEFRIKQDVVPGLTTVTWFEATAPGVYNIFCAEYCGNGHSTMRGQVVALTPGDYERRAAERPDLAIGGPEYEEPAVVGELPRESLTLAQMGERVAARHGCLRCHSTDGTPHIGPSFAGMFGSTVEMTNGERVEADGAYITQSMMDPGLKIRAGYQPVMPSYQGFVTAAETGAILEYIKSLRDPVPQMMQSPLPLEVPEVPTAEGVTEPPPEDVAGEKTQGPSPAAPSGEGDSGGSGAERQQQGRSE